MAPGWEFLVADSRSMEVIGALRNAHSRQLEVDLNKSGSASGWSPMTEPIAPYIYPWSTCLIVNYSSADRESFTFWSGPFNSRNTDMEGNKVSYSAVGWFERLMHLNLQDLTLSFSYVVDGVDVGVDAGLIAAALLAKARELDPLMPITLGLCELTQRRTITYSLDQNIGQAIIDLANLESGFDWYVDPIDRTLNIVAKRGAVLESCRWTYIADGRSENSNLANCVEDVDGSTLANDVRARGKFGSGLAIDVVSQDGYGVFMVADSLSDVTDTNILVAYANAEVVFLAQPRTTYTLTPKPSTNPTVPRLFRDFDIGDTTFLTARKHFISIESLATRVFGATLAISDVGTETITNLQITAS